MKLRGLALDTPAQRAKASRSWKDNFVIPAIRAHESVWFKESVASLTLEAALPLDLMLPLRQPMPLVLRWAPWGKTMWKFYLARVNARVTLFLPLWIWDCRTVVEQLAQCPLCSAEPANLSHVLCTCRGTAAFRCDAPALAAKQLLIWILAAVTDMGDIELRCKLVGPSVLAIVHALRT